MADEKEDQVPIEDDDSDCAVFSDEPKFKNVKVKSKEGKVTKYVLKEMMGPDLCKWQAFDATRIRVTRNKIDMAPDAFKEYSATLINLCMFTEAGERVPIPVIKAWTATMITGIFDLCQEMNGLNSEGRDNAKKV